MDLTDLSICKMTNKDLNEIKDCLMSDFDDFWDYTTLKNELSSPFSNYFVVKYSNQIVAFAGIKFILDEVELMNIVTKKSERHKKIATYLLNYLIDFCKLNKKNLINLEVNAKNSIAINFYKKHNFKQVNLRKNYYNGTDDAIIMVLNLNDENV